MPGNATLTARNEAIIDRVMAGESITAIADDYDLSNRTVWKVFRTTTGMTIKEARGYRLNGGIRREITPAQVHALHDEGLALNDIARRLDCSWWLVRDRLEEATGDE